MISLHQARAVIAAAAAAGLAGDVLLRVAPWGLNFPVWVALCAAAAASVTASSRGAPWWHDARWYAPALAFAACVAWRDAPQLVAWNVLGTGLALLLPTLRARVDSLAAASVGAYVLEPIRTGVSVAVGPAVAATELAERSDLRPASHLKPPRAILVGLLLAVPVGLVFGSLLTSADPVFEHTLRRLFDWDLGTVVSHVLVAGALAWITAGYLLRALDSSTAMRADARAPSAFALGLVELAIPLGFLVLLFAAFVVIQVRYLFGGEALVQSTAGLSYADYARRGFFELIAVIGLVLPLLIATDWLVDRKRPGTVRGFRILAGMLLALTLVIVASTLERMRIYVGAYGLTVDRIYASSVMAWAVVALAWFAGTVLRGGRHRFAFGAMVAGFAALAALNIVNPDHLAARVNLERADRGRALDVQYLSQLSADAVPTVLAELPRLNVAMTCRDLERIEARWAQPDAGWRRWNIGRARARRAVQDLDAAWAAGCVAGD